MYRSYARPPPVYVAVEVLGASTRVGHRSCHSIPTRRHTQGYYVGVMLTI